MVHPLYAQTHINKFNDPAMNWVQMRKLHTGGNFPKYMLVPWIFCSNKFLPVIKVRGCLHSVTKAQFLTHELKNITLSCRYGDFSLVNFRRIIIK